MDVLDKCYLCGKKARYTGTFTDNNWDIADWLMGKLQKGKTRFFCFSLCEKCFSLPNKEKLVEKRIESDAKMRRGYSVKSIK